MEIVQVNPQEFGLTEEVAKNIKDQFMPMLNLMEQLEEEYNHVVSLPIEDANTSKLAKALRLRYRDVRKGTEEIHKKQKAFYLNGGRFVDGWKNAQGFASQGKEEKLKEIECYAENLEKAKVEELHRQRVELIKDYVEDTTALYLGTMESDVWDAYYTAKKKAYEDRVEAERVARELKAKEEAKAKLGIQRKSEILQAGLWNYLQDEEPNMDFSVMTDKFYSGLLHTLNLRKQNDEAEQKRIREENERFRKEQQELEQKLDKERREAEAERAKLRAELEKKEKEQREAERLKQLEEEKARKEALKLAKAPLKKQLKVWIDSFSLPDFTGEKNEVVNEINSKFVGFISWAKSQVDSI